MRSAVVGNNPTLFRVCFGVFHREIFVSYAIKTGKNPLFSVGLRCVHPQKMLRYGHGNINTHETHICRKLCHIKAKSEGKKHPFAREWLSKRLPEVSRSANSHAKTDDPNVRHTTALKRIKYVPGIQCLCRTSCRPRRIMREHSTGSARAHRIGG